MLHRWWNLSKLVTNTLVNFGHFFNSIILSPPPLMMIIDVYAPTHTLFVTHAPSKAYDYTMGVADARLMT